MSMFIVISGVSAVGKTTVVKQLLQNYAAQNVKRVISYTTRTPRIGEQQGIDYQFVSLERFEQLKKKDFFIEWNNIFGHYYGVAKKDITGCAPLTMSVLDRNGVRNVKNLAIRSCCIWLQPKNISVLKKRLLQRTGCQAELSERLVHAQAELHKEYINPVCDYHIIHQSLSYTVNEIITIINSECQKK